MRAKKLSYQDLSDITKIHKATLQRYFTGKSKKIPIERIWPIAFALDTTPNYLMGDTDDPSPHYVTTTACTITGHTDILHNPQIEITPEIINKIKQRIKTDQAMLCLLEKIIDLDAAQIKSVNAFLSVLTREDD
jgi:transcriptional regulator with XRE-family HTH domain